jgi:hypothetical protein
MTPRLPPKHLRVFFARRAWVRESLYRHQGCFEASDCGQLGRQAAGHPWSALRVVKSCRKTAQRPRCCSKLKQQLYIQNGTRAHYLNYLQRGRMRRGKEAQAIGLASQSDRQKSDGQTGRNKADERWYPSRPCSALNSGLYDTTATTETHM